MKRCNGDSWLSYADQARVTVLWAPDNPTFEVYSGKVGAGNDVRRGASGLN